MSQTNVQQALTWSVNHIRLSAVNAGKLSELDALWMAYQPLCVQYIRTAVKQCVNTHPNTVFVIEELDVSGMRFKARQMNSYLKASQIGHIQDHLRWVADKRGIPIVDVPAAYSSQCCPVCSHADRANRPDQRTFRCVVCGLRGHADVVAATNLKARLTDTELCQCRNRDAIKELLKRRHADWQAARTAG